MVRGLRFEILYTENPGYPLICATVYRQYNSPSKHAVFRLENADSSVLFGNRAYAMAAIAVARTIGNRQAVADVHFALIWIFYLDKEVIQPYAAVQGSIMSRSIINIK